MQMSNTEMGYQMWIEYLVKIACAIYQMDPTEINFDLRGSSGAGQQPTFVSNNEAQQKMSKDKGLRPLLRFFEDMFNRHIVHRIDAEFELAFVGLDAKSEAEAIELRQKQGMTHLTINEVRALEDLDPIPSGDVIMNPTYTAYLLQQQAMQTQGGAGGGAPGGGQPPDGGAEDQGEQPQQPYANRFGNAGSKPTDGAKQGKQTLQAMSDQHRGEDDDADEDHDIRMLKKEDWESSVHASVRNNDLRKSNEVADFFEIDL